MALTPGSRLGVYEVTAPVGEGGMGQVYRATDTTLGRQVAIKILPDAFAADPERLARFEREAKTLASLNHPHIAAIYAVEKSAGMHALVMELVEGEDLSQRIARGALPLDDALPIAKQIAEALEAAHEQGVIHRDLKPANIKVRGDGTVKVLDFGLAKALEPTGALSASASMSPTITTPAMTQAGMILGTAAYMSPEQAKGRTVDRRADVWAFGAVLYEMLTGQRAFAGEDVSDTLANVLKMEPAWEQIPADVPARILLVLRACLQKNAKQRIGDVQSVRLALEGAFETAVAQAPPPVADVRSRRVAALAASALLVGAVTGAAAWFAARITTVAPAAASGVTRSLLSVASFDMRPPAAPGVQRGPTRPDRTGLALSPDGRTLVFLGRTGPAAADSRLYRRPLDSLDATPIEGTEGAETAFFSPDGAWIGLATATEIKKVPFAGGPASTIAKMPTGQRTHGVSWGEGGPDGVIVFSTLEGVWRVSGAGGTPTSLVKPEPAEYAYKLPSLLPGGDAMLVTIQQQSFEWEGARVAVRSLSTGEQKVLLEDAADARYASSGHLLFMRRGVLMAAPFDATRLEVTGGAVAVIDGVMHAIETQSTVTDSGAAQYATAADGTLVYADGGVTPTPLRALVWVTRTGAVERLVVPEDRYLMPRLAPGGRHVAVWAQGSRRTWLHDLDRSGRTPLTGTAERGVYPVWSPDGRSIALQASSGSGQVNLYRRAADGTGSLERLTTSPNSQSPSDWSPDGTVLAFLESAPGTRNDIWMLDVNDPNHGTRPWLQTTAAERYPTFSPNGRWLAYSSDESGRDEVYVQPFPGPGPRVRVSADGGDASAWGGDGAELFYVSLASPLQPPSMMVVPVKAMAAELSAGTPRKLFDLPAGVGLSNPNRAYDVTRDGQRFLMVRALEAPPPPPSRLVLVSHWLDELRRRVPVR